MPMILTVTDTAWGIDRKSGNRSQKVVAKEKFELSLGKLPPVGPAGKVFEVTALTDSEVTLLLNRSGKTVTLGRGESYAYRPMSMDGGHYYLLEVK